MYLAKGTTSQGDNKNRTDEAENRAQMEHQEEWYIEHEITMRELKYKI